MRVAELWRYPVKSLQGEPVARTDVGPEGLLGDRQWALFDRDSGSGLTARRVPDLLFAAGRLTAAGVEVVLPDGTATTDDDVLSDWLARPVTLRAAAETTGERRYENPAEVRDDGESGWSAFSGAGGAFHDSSRFRVSLVTTATLGTWDRRRFRANVLLDGAGEDALVGRVIRLGAVGLRIVRPVSRCVLVTRPQPGGIGRDTSVLETVHRERGGTLAVGALVAEPGTVQVGDELMLRAEG